jgi:hypothetical protein
VSGIFDTRSSSRRFERVAITLTTTRLASTLAVLRICVCSAVRPITIGLPAEQAAPAANIAVDSVEATIERRTMPLASGMMFSAARISTVGDLRGTGFLLTVKSEALEGVDWGYLVTAHHVIKSQIELRVETIWPDPLSSVRP